MTTTSLSQPRAKDGKTPYQSRFEKFRKQQRKEVPQSKLKGPLFDQSKLQRFWRFQRRIGPGLINGHNTCFMNSVLQCLTYTPPLAQYLLTGVHREKCTMKTYCALCSMETHVRRCFKDPKSMTKGAAILPGYFTGNLKSISKMLRLGRQEDSHEFMLCLMDAMQKASIHGLGKLQSKVEETTMLYQIFGGKLQSQLKCYSCKATSNTYDAFLDLSVDLHKADTVQKALGNFTKVDIIGGNDPNNKYKCDACKQMVTAGKQMTINKLPMILNIHLKRFAFDMQYGDMRKVNTKIRFPEVLDMKDYISKGNNERQSTVYRLYALLVHSGYGCHSGHYYAYVKNADEKWYCMDDECVTPASLKEVLSQQAYMLFYTQCPTDAPSETAKPSTPPPAVSEAKDTQQQNKKKEVKEAKEETEPMPKAELKRKSSDEESTETNAQVAVNKKRKTEVKEKRPIKKEEKPYVVVSDHPGAWVVGTIEDTFQSLRGNLSPPTFTAAVSDESTWEVLPDIEGPHSQQITLKWLKRMASWRVEDAS
ncbi:uncharacterized protein BYT42DRAFT_497734 [Radiomyces spectabilis]|uniref:uncharacterized protein n=1 Tax=Radiomyces spectabilis TaxID=64574 RepID=UPI0022205437|nr:uncharacterized protein BYT42DRAFT_497734 [Radiomyces spectabilis]KAI8377455.1 hypothetical protein BYT42DRAFT_497734 [Radiomyces spectabilis]